MMRLAVILLLATATLAQGPGTAERVAAALLEARLPSVDAPIEAPARILDAARRDARSSMSELLVQLAADRADDIVVTEAWWTAVAAFRDAEAHPLAALALERAALRSALLHGDPTDRGADPVDTAPGFARRLLVVGPLGDSGDHFVHEPFAATRRFPAVDTPAPGRFGPVTPYLVERDPRSTDIDLRRRDDPRSGAFVARHRIEVRETVRGFVELHCRGSFALFVDGNRIDLVDRAAERRPQRIHLPVTLTAGPHDVVVLTGDVDRSTLALRYVDAAGATLATIAELDPRAAPVPGPAPATERFDSRFQTGLDSLLDAAGRPDASLRLLAAAILEAFEHEATDRALQLLHAAEARLAAADAAADPATLLAFGEIRLRHADDLPREVNQSVARDRIFAAVDAAPDHVTAILRRAELLAGEDRLEDAIAALSESLAAGIGGPMTRAELARLLDRIGDGANADQQRLATAAFRDRLGRIDAEQRALDVSGARRLAREAAALRPGDASLLARRTRLAVAAHDWPAAVSGFRDQVARAPSTDFGELRRRASFAADVHARGGDEPARAAALAAGDPELAAAIAAPASAWRAVVAHADADTDDLERGGRQLFALGDDEAAIAAWQAALDRDPSRHVLRRTLNRLAGATDGEPRLTALRIGRDEVDAMVAGFVAGEREAGASSTLLLDRMVVVFRTDGSYVREVHQVRRLNDQAGVAEREEARAAASADEVIRLRTILPDGSSVVPKRVNRSFAMPKLAPGAVIEELWCERGDAPRTGPIRGPEFLFQSADEPFVVSELVWVLPPGMRGRPRPRNVDFEPVVTRAEDGSEVWTWRRQDVPRLVPEPFAPPLDETAPAVTWGEDRDSDAELRQLRAAAHDQYRVTPWIRAATAEVLAGLDGDRAKLAAIHAFVHTTIESDRGSADPTAILLRQQGPRFFLEVAMLRAADIPLDLAAAAPLDEEFEAIPRFVGDRPFSMPAVRVRPRDGAPTWLFADTPRHAPPGFLTANRAGAAVLLLDSGLIERLSASPATAQGWTVDGRLELDAAGDATMTATAILGEVPGYRLADQISRLDRARRDLAARNLAAQLFEGWTVDAAEIPQLSPGERFRIVATLRRRGLARAGQALRSMPLPLPASALASRFGGTPRRDQPLQIVGPTLESWTIRVVTGPDRPLIGAPDDLRIRDRLLDYALIVEPTEDGALVRRRSALRAGDLAAGFFAEWFEQCLAIDRAESGRLEFAAGER